ILSELHGLDVPAPQMQSSDLVDYQLTQSRAGGLEKAAVGLEVLQGQIVGRVIDTAIRVARIGCGEQVLNRRLVHRKHMRVVCTKPSHGVRLDYPVHLNLISGPVYFGQGKPVQQASRGVEPGRRGEKFAQFDRTVDRVRVLQEYVHGYRLGREKRAQIEQ